jgi:hypothetical protein
MESLASQAKAKGMRWRLVRLGAITPAAVAGV